MDWIPFDWGFHLVVIFIFLILKGFFSGSELAMVNADKIHLRHQARLGDPGAKVRNWCWSSFERPTSCSGRPWSGPTSRR